MATDEIPESGDDAQEITLLHWAGVLLWYICWPVGIAIYYIVYSVAAVVLFIAKLCWRPLAFVLLPVLYLGEFILACFTAPFRLLAKFEVLHSFPTRACHNAD